MKKNKKTTGILAAILIVLVVIVAAIIIVFSVRGKKSTESTTETIDAAGKHHVEIQVKNYGTIKVELDGEGCSTDVVSRSVARDESKQLLVSRINGIG